MAAKKNPLKGMDTKGKKPAFKFKGEGPNPVYRTADDARKAATERAYQLRGETAEDKKFRLIMEKYKYDITKIPGYKP